MHEVLDCRKSVFDLPSCIPIFLGRVEELEQFTAEFCLVTNTLKAAREDLCGSVMYVNGLGPEGLGWQECRHQVMRLTTRAILVNISSHSGCSTAAIEMAFGGIALVCLSCLRLRDCASHTFFTIKAPRS